MDAAIFVAIFVATFCSIIIALSGKHWRAAEDRARERRMKEHLWSAKISSEPQGQAW